MARTELDIQKGCGREEGLYRPRWTATKLMSLAVSTVQSFSSGEQSRTVAWVRSSVWPNRKVFGREQGDGWLAGFADPGVEAPVTKGLRC